MSYCSWGYLTCMTHMNVSSSVTLSVVVIITSVFILLCCLLNVTKMMDSEYITGYDNESN